MELRLHVQPPGAPSLLEAIAVQDALDWQEARAHCITAGRPVPPETRAEPKQPRMNRLDRFIDSFLRGLAGDRRSE